jgi:hypothetical protein
MIQYYHQMALTGEGQAYLDAERALIAQGQEAVPFLHERLKDASSFEKIVIQVILQRIARNETLQAVLDFLDRTEQETAPTVKGAPSPEWVAGKLYLDYGSRVASLLGVYLNKLASIWPNWKIMCVILYLGKLNSIASSDALIKFVTATPSEHYRKFGLQMLVAIGDASVLDKLEAELKSRTVAHEVLQRATDQINEKLKKLA